MAPRPWQRSQLHLFDPDLYLGSVVMLYVFEWPDDEVDEYAGLIKIGYSRHPAARHRLEFPDTRFVCACEGTVEEEADIHERLRPWATVALAPRNGYSEIYYPSVPVLGVVTDLYNRSVGWLADTAGA